MAFDLIDNLNEGPKDDTIEYNVVAEGWNLVQDGFKCCGINEYKDWTNTTIMNDTNSGFIQFVKVRS